MDAYVGNLINLIEEGAYVSSDKVIVAKRTTALFIAFLKPNIKSASKFTIMAYIRTYCNPLFH